jgi:hypothetical protein
LKSQLEEVRVFVPDRFDVVTTDIGDGGRE